MCKKTVILASFEATLLETKYIACKIVNKRSLNIKNHEFRGPYNKYAPLRYVRIGRAQSSIGKSKVVGASVLLSSSSSCVIFMGLFLFILVILQWQSPSEQMRRCCSIT